MKHLPIFALVACCCVASCRTTADTAPRAAGTARFDAYPPKGWEYASRIVRSGIVAVNGHRLPQTASSVGLRPGKVEVTVRFGWPHGGSAEADLAFRATAGRRYFVRYLPHPPATLDDYSPMRPIPFSGSEADAFMFPVWMATRTAEQSAKVAAYRARVRQDARKRTEHTDILVVSSHQPEGVVCRVRIRSAPEDD